METHVDLVNAADPETLAALLRFGSHSFPESEVHLIYRGHSFIPEYSPGSQLVPAVAPFAYSFPGSAYGPDLFIESFRRAGLAKPLGSVTLAACSMASLELAAGLSPYAKEMLAPQVDILETLAVGFYLSFLKDPDLPKDPVGTLARSLLSSFDKTSELTEAEMEYPLSRIQLSAIGPAYREFRRIRERLNSSEVGFAAGNEQALLEQSRVERLLSQRYIDYLKSEGKTEKEIGAMIQFVRAPSDDPFATDAGIYLEGLRERLSQGVMNHALARQVDRLRIALSSVVEVLNQPAHSQKTGLTFRSR